MKQLFQNSKSKLQLITSGLNDKLVESNEKLSNLYATSNVREWLASQLIKSIQSFSSEKDRLDTINALALAREVVSSNQLTTQEKVTTIYKVVSVKKVATNIFNHLSEAVKNYSKSDIPLAVKVAIPLTLTASAVIGGSSVGIVGFGTGIGAPALLLVFLGAAGITSIIEAFLNVTEARTYISVILSTIVKDEVYRRANQAMKKAMTEEVYAPAKYAFKDSATDSIKDELLAMDPFLFEQHVMSFFQMAGYVSWVTKRSNDAGVDGFVKYEDGLIVVQCKRNTANNLVGRPVVQQFKGVLEENEAVKGYIVTTTGFTTEALSSAEKNSRIELVDINKLIEWHLHGLKISQPI